MYVQHIFKNMLQNFLLPNLNKYFHNDTCETEMNININLNNGNKNY